MLVGGAPGDRPGGHPRPVPVDDVVFRVASPVNDGALTGLLKRAFKSTGPGIVPWPEQLERHSLTRVQAFVHGQLVGFVNVCWDGGSHAFVLDTVVDGAGSWRRPGPNHQLVHSAVPRPNGSQPTPHLAGWTACGVGLALLRERTRELAHLDRPSISASCARPRGAVSTCPVAYPMGAGHPTRLPGRRIPPAARTRPYL